MSLNGTESEYTEIIELDGEGLPGETFQDRCQTAGCMGFANVMFRPCCHVRHCEDHAFQVDKCSDKECRTVIDKRVKIGRCSRIRGTR